MTSNESTGTDAIRKHRGEEVDLHQTKALLQSHFSDGCALIIGSGLSCAEGLPGMTELAEHLKSSITHRVQGGDRARWEEILSAIGENGLEAALLAFPPSSNLEMLISTSTGNLIRERESHVISEVFNGKRVLRLTRLLPYILRPTGGLPIITTNYDRLVEIATEESGLGVDNMFSGRFLGHLNERESRLSFCRDYTLKGKQVQLRYAPRARVYKPHGSLDWYLRDETPVFYTGDIHDATRLIITPGHNKFRNGYNSPFDVQRAKANDAIDRASRFIIIGYGFNDDHLETHLSPAIKSGKPTLMLTHTLSKRALELAKAFRNVIAVEKGNDGTANGTRIIVHQSELFFPDLMIWDVHEFASEILEP